MRRPSVSFDRSKGLSWKSLSHYFCPPHFPPSPCFPSRIRARALSLAYISRQTTDPPNLLFIPALFLSPLHISCPLAFSIIPLSHDAEMQMRSLCGVCVGEFMCVEGYTLGGAVTAVDGRSEEERQIYTIASRRFPQNTRE